MYNVVVISVSVILDRTNGLVNHSRLGSTALVGVGLKFREILDCFLLTVFRNFSFFFKLYFAYLRK